MDTQMASSSPAFTRMPVELLDAILNHCIADKAVYSYWRSM